MTDQPTFEYRDEDGDDLIVRPMRGVPAIMILTGTNGIAVDLDRVEEVVAGIRDAARTAARQTTGQDDTQPTVADATAMLHRMHADAGLPAPAVGQPAEAHDTDRAALDRAFKDTRTRALIDAAETLTEACPDHGTGTTCTVRCYCDAADIIRRMTAAVEDER